MSEAAFVEQSYDSWVIQTVRVVVHSLGPVKPGANISYNHWTVSLLVAPNEQTLILGPTASVHLDMQPEGPRNGELRISILNYLITNNATRYFDFNITSGRKVTVAIVKALLKSNRRHRYTMTEHGGCQWWWSVSSPSTWTYHLTQYSWNVIHDLVQAGHVPSTAADELTTVLKNNYSITLPPIAHNIELGTFY